MAALWLAFSAVTRTVNSTEADATWSETLVGDTDAAAAKDERRTSCCAKPTSLP